MQLAQKLYEGVQLSDGRATGLITYMRTDGLHVGITLAAQIYSLQCRKWLDNLVVMNHVMVLFSLSLLEIIILAFF